MSDDRILLHVCCGPCSTVAVPWWRAEGLEPQALFVNPNIQPDVEYLRRRQAMEDFARAVDLSLEVDGSSGPEAWVAAVGESNAPAAGGVAVATSHGFGADGDAPHGAAAARCRACLELRLGEAARVTAARGLARFSTSLSVSPYQHHEAIVTAGERAGRAARVEFVYADLRPLYRRSIDESRRLGLYRQPYCGCVPSKWEAWAQRLERRRGRRPAA